ncbi:MAG: Exodeoxyribonuclease 7 large subunit [Alphaproteobacteria bacterium MarineAlpha9_Bin4]|nr:MAG: Exodeoxyribonuclease 7 large subunit [Alphaproteobacteria bacterium MarineAlpha9_Bin4]
MSNIPEYSVSELSYMIKKKLEGDFSYIQIRGEISDLKLWNGHFLFNLKDDKGLLNARIWKNRVPFLNFHPEEGLEISATGKISTHPKRSNYNLIIDNINAVSEGELLKLIELRKNKLKEAGIFNKSTALPLLPKKIGVITSPTGAVIEDIKNKILLRFPSHILIWPISVQGLSAETDIINAIKGMNLLKKNKIPDVIIIARGGGSVEDLMPFNSEKVAYEIYNSKIPIVSAVGHETDYTLADFAADYRASTPTAAADMVVPDRKEIETKISTLSKNKNTSIKRIYSNATFRFKQANLRFIDPNKLINNNKLKFENSLLQLIKFKNSKIIEKENILKVIKLKSPTFLVINSENNYNRLKKNIDTIMFKYIKNKIKLLENKADLLFSISYERWLEKGFAIIKNKENKIIKDARNLNINEEVIINFSKGSVDAKVKKIK